MKRKRKRLLREGSATLTSGKPIFRVPGRIYTDSADLINRTWWKDGLTNYNAFTRHQLTLEIIAGLALTPADNVDFDNTRFVCTFAGVDFPDKRVLLECWTFSGRSRLTIYSEESQQIIKSGSCSYGFLNRAFEWLNERKPSPESEEMLVKAVKKAAKRATAKKLKTAKKTEVPEVK